MSKNRGILKEFLGAFWICCMEFSRCLLIPVCPWLKEILTLARNDMLKIELMLKNITSILVEKSGITC
jgi:hypothetical protein